MVERLAAGDSPALTREGFAADLIVALASAAPFQDDDEEFDEPSQADENLQTPSFPKAARNLIAEMLKGWDGTTPLQDGVGLVALCEWITCYYEALGLGQWDEETPCPIDLSDMQGRYTDSDPGRLWEATEWSSDDDEEPQLTDQLRVEYLRLVLTERGDAVDGLWYCCGTVQLDGSSRSGVLAFSVRGSALEGLWLNWFGVFATADDAWAYLRSCGWVFDDQDVDALSDDELLSLWGFEDNRPHGSDLRIGSPKCVRTTRPAFIKMPSFQTALSRALVERLKSISEQGGDPSPSQDIVSRDSEATTIRQILRRLDDSREAHDDA